jgi:hypothetical protein
MAETILCYGESGTYKSSNLGEAADYIYETTGGVSLLLSSDSGWEPMRDQINRGVIVPWNLNSATHPLSSLMRASKGYWPEVLIDGKADEKTMTLLPRSMYCTRHNPAKEGEYKIGGMLVEGLATNGELLKANMEETRRSTGEPLVAQFEEMGESFALGSRGTYMFVQNQTRKYVHNMKPLPCDRIIFSSHEGKGEDEKTKRPIFGPAIVGKASTDKVPQWFDTTIHFESYATVEKRKGKDGKVIEVNGAGVRAFFDRHQDNEVKTIFWPAKTSVTPHIKAQILKEFPSNYFALKLNAEGQYVQGLHTFLKLMDECGEAGGGE